MAELTRLCLFQLCFFISGVWALVQSRFSALDFDYLGFAIERIGEYFKKKDEFLALSVPE